MKISLICPKFPEDYILNGLREFSDFMVHTPLGLYLVATLTPEDVDVTIVDENKEEIDFDQPVDLVGLHVMENFAPRAQEIARRYRERGARVVMGGFYPTLVPEDARKHCDAVVVGEAEPIWQQLIQDFQRGNLQEIYKSDSFIDMNDIPIIRRAAIPEGHRFFHVETTRGCPHRCDYCSVTSFYGNSYRNRGIDKVLEQIHEVDEPHIFFTDDNVVSNKKYAKELFENLSGLRKLWFAQSSIDIAKSDELLGLAAESGCYLLLFGFETLLREGMERMNKKWADPERYPALIKRIHDAGISINGTFMFGLDDDDKGVFERTVLFCVENKIEMPEFFILRPHRGTPLAERLIRENRVKKEDLGAAKTGNVCFDPLHMSREELEEGYKWAWKEVYSKKAMKRRLEHILPASTFGKFDSRKRRVFSDFRVNIRGRNSTKDDLIIGANMALHHLTKDFETPNAPFAKEP